VKGALLSPAKHTKPITNGAMTHRYHLPLFPALSAPSGGTGEQASTAKPPQRRGHAGIGGIVAGGARPSNGRLHAEDAFPSLVSAATSPTAPGSTLDQSGRHELNVKHLHFQQEQRRWPWQQRRFQRWGGSPIATLGSYKRQNREMMSIEDKLRELGGGTPEVIAERKPLVREKRAAGRGKKPICEVEP
jgi:hypothetical protein